MNDAPYRLGFIGAGKIASSVVRGLLLKHYCAPSDIIASEPNSQLRTRLETELEIAFTTENTKVAAQAEMVFLGVKPQVVLPVLQELGHAALNKLIVSFAAGVPIIAMESVTPARVMRVMTNTPSAIARGATAYAAGRRTTEEDCDKVREVFTAIGTAVRVSDEQIDVVTALAGSGPAFIYSVIQALAGGAVAQGLNAEAASKLAAQTTLGAAELALSSGKSPEELIQMVVTPAGTTAAGLRVMEERSTAESIAAAVEAATKRGREMAQKNR